MNIKTKIKILAYYQIAAGITGYVMTIPALADSINSASVTFVLSFAFVLYSFSIYCGWQLLSKEIQKGLMLSLVNQAMQTINFSIAGYALKYISGLGILIGLDLTDGSNITFSAALSSFEIKLNSGPEIVTISINIVAFYIIYRVGKLQREIKSGKIETNGQLPSMLDTDLITGDNQVE